MQMNPEELRKGVFVFHAGKYKVVNGYHTNRVYMDKKTAGFIASVKPIPLSRDWLVNFGFVENPMNHSARIKYDCKVDTLTLHVANWQNNPGWLFQICVEDGTCISLHFIKYVHELQNLCYTVAKKELQLKTIPNDKDNS